MTVIKRIDFFVRYAVEEACLNYNPVFLPFPARSQTNVENYVLGLARVLSEEIEKSNLPKECSEHLPLEI